ncbi:hypothetical protein CTAYLR_007437 [Chrysophaeum taylorii]|uniref:Glutathione S-transferase n=1 Tax=Chrysophaeum taylorii TaxID=2483200 RepID=A0AAD7UA46_9STRA|nr:hypothetical protein CTAYLR_007437 [Chrysophaeum taylorii]
MVQSMITLYGNRMCPYAQRCVISLEYVQAAYENVEVNLYGSGGFTKAQLQQVEARSGLEPKGYVPVLRVASDVVRESSMCVRRVAREFEALEPGDAAAADRLIELCDGKLSTEGRRAVEKGQRRSAGLDECLREVDEALEGRPYLAGQTFSTADACLVPFLFRVDQGLEIPAEYDRLREYLTRVLAEPHVKRTMPRTWWWWW